MVRNIIAVWEKSIIHVANANQTFTNTEIVMFKNVTQKAEAFISTEFVQFDYEVDVIITTPSFMLPAIAEDGIAGKTLHSRLIIISVDKNQHKICEEFVFETICHEMSHSLRWEKVPEYAKTMLGGDDLRRPSCCTRRGSGG